LEQKKYWNYYWVWYTPWQGHQTFETNRYKQKLLLAAKALYFVFSTVSTLFKNANNKAELLKDHKILILNTISKVRSSLGVKRVLKWIGISPAKMYYWLEERNCQLSISKLCRSTHPNQLLDKEVQTIKDYLLNNRYKNWSALSIYYQALKDQALFISIETWYKYARKLGIKRKFFKLKYKREIGLRATSPLQILHMDVTIFKPCTLHDDFIICCPKFGSDQS